VANLGRLGIPASDVIIVLDEVPLENWGIRGGTPASDVDLGSEVGV
jgi:phenylpyruvate tautomerase PptA (4-oxalocrotonate tautomerase family)